MSKTVLELIKNGNAVVRLVNAPQKPKYVDSKSIEIHQELEQLNDPINKRPKSKYKAEDRQNYYDQLSNKLYTRDIIAKKRPPLSQQKLISKPPAMSEYWKTNEKGELLKDYKGNLIPKIKGIYKVSGGPKNTIFTKKKFCYLLPKKGLIKHYDRKGEFIPIGFIYDLNGVHLKGERYIWDREALPENKSWTGPIYNDDGIYRVGPAGKVNIKNGLSYIRTNAKSIRLSKLKKNLIEAENKGIIPNYSTALFGLSKKSLKSLFTTKDYITDRLNLFRVAILAQTKKDFVHNGRYNFSLLIIDGNNPPKEYSLDQIKKDIACAINTVRSDLSSRHKYKILLKNQGIIELLYGKNYLDKPIYKKINDKKVSSTTIADEILDKSLNYVLSIENLIEIVKDKNKYTNEKALKIISKCKGSIDNFSELLKKSVLTSAIEYDRDISFIKSIINLGVNINKTNENGTINAIEIAKLTKRKEVIDLLTKNKAIEIINYKKNISINKVETFKEFFKILKTKDYLKYLPSSIASSGINGLKLLIIESLIYILNNKLENTEEIKNKIITKYSSINNYINHLKYNSGENMAFTETEQNILSWFISKQSIIKSFNLSDKFLEKIHKMEKDIMPKEYYAGSGLRLGGLETNKIHYQHLGNNFFPQVPICHPYNISTDKNDRIEAGPLKFQVSAKIPSSCKNSLPKEILDLLKNKKINNCEIKLSLQNMPWKNDTLLFRPHYFLFHSNPSNSNNLQAKFNVAIFDKSNKIKLDGKKNCQLSEYTYSSHTDSKIKGLICSPNNSKLSGDNFKTTSNFYSIIIPKNSNKAIITLHWLLNDSDSLEIKKIITTYGLNNKTTAFDFASTVKQFIDCSKRKNTIPINSLDSLLKLNLRKYKNDHNYVTFSSLYKILSEYPVMKKCIPNVFTQNGNANHLKKYIINGFKNIEKTPLDSMDLISILSTLQVITKSNSAPFKEYAKLIMQGHIKKLSIIDYVGLYGAIIESKNKGLISKNEMVDCLTIINNLKINKSLTKILTRLDKEIKQNKSSKLKLK